ncbi:MAG TPA: type II toxin-antitoxin system RelE/ParE family toxin [Ignavibacteria bacterium]
MNAKFDVEFLEDAIEFLSTLDEKTRNKILYNVNKSRYLNDPKLFKKLSETIWEFRTEFNKLQYRLLAFWDKIESNKTLVIAATGLIKKKDKVQGKEIIKAENLRKIYFLK